MALYLRGAKCKVGYIPAGSTNDFGASIGLSKNIIEAAKAIANDESITLDVGSFNGALLLICGLVWSFYKHILFSAAEP